jgi:hypothetical protein
MTHWILGEAANAGPNPPAQRGVDEFWVRVSIFESTLEGTFWWEEWTVRRPNKEGL